MCRADARIGADRTARVSPGWAATSRLLFHTGRCLTAAWVLVGLAAAHRCLAPPLPSPSTEPTRNCRLGTRVSVRVTIAPSREFHLG